MKSSQYTINVLDIKKLFNLTVSRVVFVHVVLVVRWILTNRLGNTDFSPYGCQVVANLSLNLSLLTYIITKTVTSLKHEEFTVSV